MSSYVEQRPAVDTISLLIKDTRSIFTIDLRNKTANMVRNANYPNNTNFPHNFCCVQNPHNGFIYLVGGGDYSSDSESLYQLWEIRGTQFTKRDVMKHPRHGHSVCWFSDKFIVVSGSRKEKNNSHMKCEMYNADIDLWFEMPDMNVGRHYHASCAMRDRWIYVFAGIANQSRKYINSIERYDNQSRSSWELINLNNKVLPERQGCGVVQKDGEKILIFGGFSGRFLSDCYMFNTVDNSIQRQMNSPNEVFLFQMPVMFDRTTNSVYAVDLQRSLVYRHNDSGQWSTHMSLRNNR